jgi:hypothetical protein
MLHGWRKDQVNNVPGFVLFIDCEKAEGEDQAIALNILHEAQQMMPRHTRENVGHHCFFHGQVDQEKWKAGEGQRMTDALKWACDTIRKETNLPFVLAFWNHDSEVQVGTFDVADVLSCRGVWAANFPVGAQQQRQS